MRQKEKGNNHNAVFVIVCLRIADTLFSFSVHLIYFMASSNNTILRHSLACKGIRYWQMSHWEYDRQLLN